MFDLIILALLCAVAGALFTLIIQQIKAFAWLTAKSKLRGKAAIRRAKVAAVAERNRAQIVEDLKKNIVNDVMIAVEWFQENNVPFWHILRRYGILHYLSESKLNHMKKEPLTLLSSDLVRAMYNPT